MTNTFSIRCAHRSGSNFLEQLIIQNSKTPLDCIQSNRTNNEWKHCEWYPSYLDGKMFTCVIARNPSKWVNSCVTFNADMWKWWDVNTNEQSQLTFDYKDRIVSIPKMITKWNRFYKNWLNSTNSYFVWYTDTIEPQSRYNLLLDLSQSYKLRMDMDNIIIPSKVEHSENYNNTKIEQEFDLDYLPNLTAKQIEYIKDNVDKDLIKSMNERRQYESSSSIQW